jgi:hypothetical protein
MVVLRQLNSPPAVPRVDFDPTRARRGLLDWARRDGDSSNTHGRSWTEADADMLVVEARQLSHPFASLV